MVLKLSGESINGVVVALLAIAIPFSVCAAGGATVRDFSIPGERVSEEGRISVSVPIPDSPDFVVGFESEGCRLDARLVETAYMRGQKIAVFEILSPVEPSGRIDVTIEAPREAGDICVDTGPLTRLCNSTLVGYGVAPALQAMDGPGVVTRCHNISECRSAMADILLIAGHLLYNSAYVDSLAGLWAGRMGLNVAIIDVTSISAYSPVEIRDFIRSVYISCTAEHFGDGRLGFVVLLGDAYEDDNLTPMVPEYDGYGGDAAASDHFYACVSGTDDYEDIMIGRIPAGTELELSRYYSKLASYTPLPAEAWTKSLLFAGGCYFAQKQDYVAYFDSLESYVPEGIKVSKFYRHDFPATDLGDAQACAAMLDSLAAGRLFLLYSGDGDKWDWGARLERVFRSDLIDNLDNVGRLPIVLSISCSNGWFDNVTDAYKDGGFDCFAERILTEADRGAIACLASSRETGGSASTVFAPEIIKSAYVNGSTFLGELILEAKTQHLAKLGQVKLVRQFNLFGDPCLNFALNQLPIGSTDLLVRPYSIEIGPVFPRPEKPLEIEFEVWNAGAVPVEDFTVSLYSGHPDSGGTVLASRICEDFWGWEKRKVTFVVDEVDAGDFSVYVMADATGDIAELDEANNLVAVRTYVYPFESGYPIKLGADIKGQVMADLNADGDLEIIITSAGAYAAALDLEGSFLWVREDLGPGQMFPGIKPSAFDINGDGATEAILTTKSSLLVAEGETGETVWQRYTEYPALSPVVTDTDGDGAFEILMPTYDFIYSRIHAFDASGAYVWSHQIPTYREKATGIVVCDNELDGYKEVIFSTDDGDITCLSCITNPPSSVWDEHISSDPISCIAAGDLERDGTIEIVAAANTTVYVLDASDGSVKETIPTPECAEQIAIGQLDGDIGLEAVCVSQCGWIFVIDGNTLTLEIDTGDTPVGSPVLADLDQDGLSEIIVTMAEGSVYLLRPSGAALIAPVPMRAPCLSGPVTEDADRDGNIEIIAGSSDSLLFVLDMGMDGGRVDWYCKGGTVTRTGLYAQPVFGTISQQITLSGRIDVVGDIRVDSAGCLVLDRGSEIRMVCDNVSPTGSSPGKCEIEVEGNLVAAGGAGATVDLVAADCPDCRDAWMGILLKNGSSATITKTRISGAVTGVECMTSDCYMSECVITDCMLGVKITESSPLIDNNTVTGNNYGISTNQATPTIVGNQVIENLYAGVILSTSSHATLLDNVIGYTTQGHGISCYSSSPSILSGNKIRDNSQCGIYLSNSSPTVDSCWIAFNGDCGIKAAYYSDAVISNTTIAENRIGLCVFVYADPVLGDTASMLGGQNNVCQNTQYALYNGTQNQIKANMTWWGSDPPDPSDFVGAVDYSGWLSMPPAGIDQGQQDLAFIHSAYPNPFSHRVTLSISASQRHVPIDIAIYDVMGRLVRKAARIAEPGQNRVEWDGRDEFGNPVASGTYYLAIRSRTGVHTAKMVLIR